MESVKRITYRMIFKVVTKHEANIVEKNDLSLWHQRLAHINCKALHEMINKYLVNGIKVSNYNAVFCECCVLGKQHKLPFNKNVRTRRSKVGELIHADLCDPMPMNSVGDSKYFFTFQR